METTKQINGNVTKNELHLSVVSGSLYVSCSKCKKVEDTFDDGEIPNEYGWIYHRKKWYCKSCLESL